LKEVNADHRKKKKKEKKKARYEVLVRRTVVGGPEGPSSRGKRVRGGRFAGFSRVPKRRSMREMQKKGQNGSFPERKGNKEYRATWTREHPRTSGQGRVTAKGSLQREKRNMDDEETRRGTTIRQPGGKVFDDTKETESRRGTREAPPSMKKR